MTSCSARGALRLYASEDFFSILRYINVNITLHYQFATVRPKHPRDPSGSLGTSYQLAENGFKSPTISRALPDCWNVIRWCIMGNLRLQNCQVHFRLNPRWRTTSKLDVFKSQWLSRGLFDFSEILYLDAMWVLAAGLVVKAKNDWRGQAASSGNAALIYSY